MRARRVDANQYLVTQALRQAGATVQPIHTVGQGCPDLLVGFRDCNYLLELKDGRGKLNDREREWHAGWKGQVTIVRTPEQALEAIGAIDTIS